MLTMDQLEECTQHLSAELDIESEFEEIDTQTPDEDGWLLIHSAAYYGHAGLLQFLLERFPEQINATIPVVRMTPLLLASLTNHYDAVQLLLRYYPHIDATDQMGRTALHLTSNGKIATLLLEAGINFNLQDRSPLSHLAGETALQTASREGKLEVQTSITNFCKSPH